MYVSLEVSGPQRDRRSLNSTLLAACAQREWTADAMRGATTPDYLHSGGALRLLLLPLRLVPVQLVEHDHQGRHQVQVLVHPARLEDPFGDVPLIRSSLQVVAEVEGLLDDNSSRNHLLSSPRPSRGTDLTGQTHPHL